ncbi:MAG: hypothetical protein ACK5RC_15565 [Curvibacter sp.]|jgi:hypothetical protein|nr:hypothetical protein [Curvibacter sp.]
MLSAAIYIKLIAEIALLALAGQWLLGLLAGARKDQNIFYKMLQTIGSPFTRVARLVSPKFVLDRHVPLVAFLLLVFVWLSATIYKVQTCVQIGLELCK